MSFVTCREAESGDWDKAMNLAWRTFMKFDAPDYTEEGIDNFKRFVESDILRTMFDKGEYRLIVAVDDFDNEIVGMISLRDDNHISLLFVDSRYQMLGIGKMLVRTMQKAAFEDTGEEILTVNAAPYAEGFYHSIGFTDTGLPVTDDGITFTPMEIYF